MDFTFNSNIPAASNNPSSDQPLMLTNNQSTEGIIGIDHVTFNTLGGGQHLQVTFNGNNVPIPPVVPPILFTNTIAGLPQLFFYSGDATHSSSQYVNATQGSTFLLGGIILKWGLKAGLVVDNQTITFSVPFPNNCYTVVATPVRAALSPSLYFTVAATPSVTGFVIRTTLSLDALSYIAIGN